MAENLCTHPWHLEREGIPEWNEFNNLYRKVTKEFIKQAKLTKNSSNSEEEFDDMPDLEVAPSSSSDEEQYRFTALQRLRLSGLMGQLNIMFNESDSGSDSGSDESDDSGSSEDFYDKDNSMYERVEKLVVDNKFLVGRDFVGRIVGKNKWRIQEIKEDFDVKIKIMSHPTDPEASILHFYRGERVNIIAACCYITAKITGSCTYQDPGNLEELKTDSSESEADSGPDQMIVDRGCVGKIIGKGGSRIREIQDQFDVRIEIVNHPTDQAASILLFSRGARVDILAACRHIGTNIL